MNMHCWFCKDQRPPDRNFSVEVFGNGALKAVADYVAGQPQAKYNSPDSPEALCTLLWHHASCTEVLRGTDKAGGTTYKEASDQVARCLQAAKAERHSDVWDKGSSSRCSAILRRPLLFLAARFLDDIEVYVCSGQLRQIGPARSQSCWTRRETPHAPGARRTLEQKDQDLDGMCCQPASSSREFLKEKAVKKRSVGMNPFSTSWTVHLPFTTNQKPLR